MFIIICNEKEINTSLQLFDLLDQRGCFANDIYQGEPLL